MDRTEQGKGGWRWEGAREWARGRFKEKRRMGIPGDAGGSGVRRLEGGHWMVNTRGAVGSADRERGQLDRNGSERGGGSKVGAGSTSAQVPLTRFSAPIAPRASCPKSQISLVHIRYPRSGAQAPQLYPHSHGLPSLSYVRVEISPYIRQKTVEWIMHASVRRKGRGKVERTQNLRPSGT